MNPQLVVGTLEQDRQDRFRVVLAGVALAESAEYALLERQAFGVDVGLAQIRWLRVGMISSHGCEQEVRSADGSFCRCGKIPILCRERLR